MVISLECKIFIHGNFLNRKTKFSNFSYPFFLSNWSIRIQNFVIILSSSLGKLYTNWFHHSKNILCSRINLVTTKFEFWCWWIQQYTVFNYYGVQLCLKSDLHNLEWKEILNRMVMVLEFLSLKKSFWNWSKFPEMIFDWFFLVLLSSEWKYHVGYRKLVFRCLVFEIENIIIFIYGWFNDEEDVIFMHCNWLYQEFGEFTETFQRHVLIDFYTLVVYIINLPDFTKIYHINLQFHHITRIMIYDHGDERYVLNVLMRHFLNLVRRKFT